MQITLEIEQLQQALALSVARRSTMAILEHALLEVASGGSVLITTSDTEKEVRVQLQGDEAQPGAATLDAARLKSAIHGLSGRATLRMEATAGDKVHGRVLLTQGRRRLLFDSHNPEEYPRLRDEQRRVVAIDPAWLAQAFDRLSYAARKDDVNPAYNGVWLCSEFAAAVDGHRMAYLPGSGEVPPMMVPAASVGVLRKALEHESVEIAVYGGGKPSALEISAGGTTVITRLLVVTFPDISRVLRNFDETLSLGTVDAAEARQVLGRAQVLGAGLGKLIKVNMAFSRTGDASVRTDNGALDDLLSVHGGEVDAEVHISAAYLGEALQVLGGEVQWQQASAGNAATLLQQAGRDDLHVIQNMTR